MENKTTLVEFTYDGIYNVVAEVGTMDQTDWKLLGEVSTLANKFYIDGIVVTKCGVEVPQIIVPDEEIFRRFQLQQDMEESATEIEELAKEFGYSNVSQNWLMLEDV